MADYDDLGDGFNDIKDGAQESLMAKISFTVTGMCASGNHMNVSANANGGAPVAFVLDANDIAQPIPDEELPIIVKYLMRTYATGKTMAETKTGAQVGVTVII